LQARAQPEHFSVQAQQLLSNNRVGDSFIPTQLLFPEKPVRGNKPHLSEVYMDETRPNARRRC
jgi:hypothetical protein